MVVLVPLFIIPFVPSCPPPWPLLSIWLSTLSYSTVDSKVGPTEVIAKVHLFFMCVLGILQKDGRKKTKPNAKNVPKKNCGTIGST